MGKEITTIIDQEKCTGCGRCVEVCPYESLSMKGNKAFVSGALSMHCGHCQAVCPVGAVTVQGITGPVRLTSADNPAATTLFDIVTRRRSCRSYKDTPVEKTMLNELINFGQWAPSGTNSQKWTFSVIPTRDGVERYAEAIADFYRKINRQAENPLFRTFSRIFFKDVLGNYYRRYYDQVKESLARWEQNGEDLLFHGATAAIMVGSRPEASCAAEDALLATQNMVLAAEALGLGTCLIGFAVEAMKRDRTIAHRMGLPVDEPIYAVIALGHPKFTYPQPSGRRTPVIRYVEPPRQKGVTNQCSTE